MEQWKSDYKIKADFIAFYYLIVNWLCLQCMSLIALLIYSDSGVAKWGVTDLCAILLIIHLVYSQYYIIQYSYTVYDILSPSWSHIIYVVHTFPCSQSTVYAISKGPEALYYGNPWPFIVTLPCTYVYADHSHITHAVRAGLHELQSSNTSTVCVNLHNKMYTYIHQNMHTYGVDVA